MVDASSSSPTATDISKPGGATKRQISSVSAQVVNNNHHHHATTPVASNSKNSTSDYALFDRKIEMAYEGPFGFLTVSLRMLFGICPCPVPEVLLLRSTCIANDTGLEVSFT